MEASISFCRSPRSRHHSASRFSASSPSPQGGGRGEGWGEGQLARYFPFLPVLSGRLVDLEAQGFQLLLVTGVNSVNLFVVGGGFERDVRDAFINEPLFDIAPHPAFGAPLPNLGEGLG